MRKSDRNKRYDCAPLFELCSIRAGFNRLLSEFSGDSLDQVQSACCGDCDACRMSDGGNGRRRVGCAPFQIIVKRLRCVVGCSWSDADNQAANVRYDENRFGFKGVSQVFCIDRDREMIKQPGSASTGTVYGITSAPAHQADAEKLLLWNRGHWTVEVNHHVRDRTFGEDAGLTRTNNGPSNRAMCNNIVLALIIRKNRFKSIPEALRHFNLNRHEAFNALKSPPAAP